MTTRVFPLGLRRFAGVLALLVLLLAPAARAQFTPTVAYQGYLTDADGAALDGVFEFTFRLFDAPAGGAAFWDELQLDVPVEEGVFSVQLGSIEPLAGVPLDQPLFLEVLFGEGGEVLSPRVPLTAVPYSLRAKALDEGALVAGDNVTIQREGETLRISAAGGGEGGVPSALAAPDGSPAQAVVVNNDGRVGVGVAASEVAAPLHVRRNNLGLPESAVEQPGIAVEASDATVGAYSSEAGTFGSALVLGEIAQKQLVDLWSLVRETSAGTGQSRLRFTYGSNPNYSVNETKLTLTAPGDIGIGTDKPESLLHLSDLGDAAFILEADTDNSGEGDNPALILRQDGNAANAFIAMEGDAGTRSPGTLANALVIGSEDDNPAVQFVTNDQVRMTIGTNGAITAPPRSAKVIVSAIEFVPFNDGYKFLRSANLLTAQTSFPNPQIEQRWFAPVKLPQDAVVTRVTSHWFDARSPEVLTIRMVRDNGFADGEDNMATLNSVGSGGNGTRTDDSIQNATIDNGTFMYFIRAVFPEGGNEFNMGLRRIVIEYTTTRIH